MSTSADEDAYVPLTDQRVFGAGIKRKRIDFIPATTTQTELNTTTSLAPTKPSTAIGSHYLSIVLPSAKSNSSQPTDSSSPSSPLCPICNQPVQTTDSPSPFPFPNLPNSMSTPHESSIAHQLCLAHSHPPSHLPRAHIGVKYLTSYGWDVDGREGLGARGEGIRIPIKVREKRDTAGLVERADDDDEDGSTVRNRKDKEKEKRKRLEKPVVLDAKALKRRDLQERERMDRLRRSFYGPDLEKYLGPDG